MNSPINLLIGAIVIVVLVIILLRLLWVEVGKNRWANRSREPVVGLFGALAFHVRVANAASG